MAVTFERVRETVSLPTADRLDFEINFLLPWFRAKVSIFKNLDKKLLFDVIKHLQLVSLPSDDVIIKQGEIGNWMCVILRGAVSIYNKDRTDSEQETTSENFYKNEEDTVTAKRKLLGNFIVTLKSGAAFGEVALMSDDCIRSASVVTDCPSDVIVIDRDLYRRSIESVLKAEYDRKNDFVQSHPYFREWPAKYKKQLVMGLTVKNVPYSNRVAKQGERIETINFIMQGELEVTTDPLAALSHQMFANTNSHRRHKERMQQVKDGNILGTHSAPSATRIPICLIGRNQSVGEIETLCKIKTHLETTRCTTDTQLLSLPLKHFERLFIKRIPSTVDQMRRICSERLRLRLLQRPSLLYIECCLELLDNTTAPVKIMRKDSFNSKPSKSPRSPTQKKFLKISSWQRNNFEQRVNSIEADAGRKDREADWKNLQNGILAWMSKSEDYKPAFVGSNKSFKWHKPAQDSDSRGNEIAVKTRSKISSVDNSVEVLEAINRRRRMSEMETSYYYMALNSAIPTYNKQKSELLSTLK